MEHDEVVLIPDLRPSQLHLPFSEGQPIDRRKILREESLENFRKGTPLQRDLLSGLAQTSPEQSKRLQAVLDYLLQRFPEFVLQRRCYSNSSLQLTLYRIQDGTFYRINVVERFLDQELTSEEMAKFFEMHGLVEKLSASALSPIIIDTTGITVPAPPAPREIEKDDLWGKLRSTLVFTVKPR
jgi:hypothetical protein